MNQFFIQGQAGVIEAMQDTPNISERPHITAVLCHPHPLFQGTMHNKVITTFARAFNQLGINAIRFNYRGVGASQGTYDKGNGELDDTLSVIDSILTKNPNQKIILAGFSFGGSVAYKAAMQRENAILSLLTVAPAIVNFHVRDYPQPIMPWCLIQGVDDEVIDYHDIAHFFVNETTADATFIRLNNVGHFFHGQLVPLREHIKSYYQDKIKKW